MSFLHKQSNECISCELDLFATPPTQTSLQSSQIVEIAPTANITMDNPFEFKLDETDEYLQDIHPHDVSAIYGFSIG